MVVDWRISWLCSIQVPGTSTADHVMPARALQAWHQ